ncbi:MAG: tRNA 4-thiouridine(8) synthase ThiI [Defluviitaleaceae bacterium]|nr:tRNA 4-thiouridine(8) synthase ThiI [Defluviitaleaceae bacterium]
MNTKKVMLVKYGEIALRKGNRSFFEHHLLDVIRKNLNHIPSVKVSREQGRFLIEDTEGDLDSNKILPLIRKIFGLAGFCNAVKTSAMDIETLQTIGAVFFKEYAAQHGAVESFKVITKRSNKNYPLTSNEISAEIGGSVMDTMPGIKVDLHNPAKTLWVELRNNVYFYVDYLPGAGGLPYGASGKGMLMLSGGFDSPVAGYLAARRGVEILPVYFHSPPFVSERAADKVRDLAAELAKFTGKIKLGIVNFSDVQVHLRDNVHPEKLTTFLKRAMLHISTAMAEKENALCIINGDSVGQVASQTLHSIAAIDSATSLTILRPLAAMDKQEIIDIAKQIETYPISIRPFEDCCTVFVAKHPENKPNKRVIERIEGQIMEGLAPLMQKAVDEAVYEVY